MRMLKGFGRRYRPLRGGSRPFRLIQVKKPPQASEFLEATIAIAVASNDWFGPTTAMTSKRQQRSSLSDLIQAEEDDANAVSAK